MNKQGGRQAATLQRPTTNDPEAWKAYWKAQDQPWRTKPEVDAKRQEYLASRRLIPSNCEQGIYPFKDIVPKLTRADVEWLLATHENGSGPIDWSDKSQRKRIGIDLRGADLKGLDLSGLPLAGMRGGLTKSERPGGLTEFQWEDLCKLAAVHLKETHLEGTMLQNAHLKKDKRNKWILAYRRAIRANRQVATILRAQGWNEVADKLDYRAQVLQRKLLYRQGIWRHRGLNAPKPNHWHRIRMIVSSRFSWLLWLVAGYGYKPWRWVCLYGLTIIVFAIFYYREKMPNAALPGVFSISTRNLRDWGEAILTSVGNLHGHNLTQGGISTVEAFVGLFVEAILIAIIAGRILGKSGGGD